MLAMVQTVEADHTTAVIDLMLFRVDARGLAMAGTESTTVAFLQIDRHLEERETGDKAQHRTHGTDRITIGTTASPSQYNYDK